MTSKNLRKSAPTCLWSCCKIEDAAFAPSTYLKQKLTRMLSYQDRGMPISSSWSGKMKYAAAIIPPQVSKTVTPGHLKPDTAWSVTQCLVKGLQCCAELPEEKKDQSCAEQKSRFCWTNLFLKASMPASSNLSISSRVWFWAFTPEIIACEG